MNPLVVSAVWAKAQPTSTPGLSIDAHGNYIRRDAYGDASSVFGWEIDHWPVAKCEGGSDDLGNLRPLHCGQNRSNGARLGAERNALKNPFAEATRETGLLGEPNVFRPTEEANALRPPRGMFGFSSRRK